MLLKSYLKCWNVKSDKTEFRSKDNIEISAVVTVPMPLPDAFAGHFCKVLSSHEEAFFRKSAQCWAFVVVPFEFPFVFLIKRWHEAYVQWLGCVGSGHLQCLFWLLETPSINLKLPFSSLFFLIDHLYVKRHFSKLLDYYYL